MTLFAVRWIETSLPWYGNAAHEALIALSSIVIGTMWLAIFSLVIGVPQCG